ncbi:MAG TPA: PQQ-binding-like beta-propeller repeat protein [Vicinamibacterales bacterium]|nr:PQQ-binding-like beta-propeller repeat protein [Vicinamibacterales bacterium]
MLKRMLFTALVLGSATALVRTQSNALTPASAEWPAVSGDLGNTRYTTLTQINRDTLGMLKGAWQTERFVDGGGGRAMPVVKDGMLFMTGGSYVYAFDAKTGATVWKHQTGASPPSANLGDFTRPEQGLPDREGVAVGDGMVFVGLSNAHAIALDEKTGKPLWDAYAGIDPPRPGQGVSGAPLYAGGVVMVGTSADPGFRGKVVGFDGKTGKKLWEWFTVPGPGVAGHETWPQDNSSWKIGGGALWLVGAADPDLGLAYFGTGNGVPQYAGDLRAGNNLYLCSIVALDIKTGTLKWYYQTIRHDIWEADIAQSPVVFNTTIDGRERKLVAAMRTDGVLFVVDRETGKPILPIDEKKYPQDAMTHTVPTQPYPRGADRMLPDCDAWSKTATIPSGFKLGCFFSPASLATPNLLTPAWGMRVTPMAYSPQTGYFYALGNAGLQWFRRAEDPYVFILGAGRVPGMPQGHGVMAAIDAKTAKIAWKKEFNGPRPSGALVTASGLLFQTLPDGHLIASDAKTGEQIWQFESGMNGGGAPAISYEIGGKQYIAVAGRNNVMAFTLNGPIEAKPEPEAPRRPAPALFAGPVADTNKIEVATYVRDNEQTVRMYVDEHAFNPYRVRVKAGTAVRWINNGRENHTIAAEDGSWTTPTLSPLEAGAHTFTTPGEYAYVCKDHPWAKGQIIVVP